MSKKRRFSLVACARWESESIQEWIVYNLNMGFEHVYIYCNDDDPIELYQQCLPFLSGPNPCVTFNYYGVQGQQSQMYAHFLENYCEETEYFAFFDLDEFLILRNHKTIPSFIDAELPSADAVHFWMVSAGHNYHKKRPDAPILKYFTRRANKVSPFTKCLARSSALDKARIRQGIGSGFFHNIAAILKNNASIVDSIGRDMSGYYVGQESNWNRLKEEKLFHESILETGFLYHVFMKSEEDLMRRYNRGIGGQFYGQAMWLDVRNNNASIDAYMGQYNEIEEFGAYNLWQRILGVARNNTIIDFIPPGAVSVGKKATQSSTCVWSRYPDPVEDASNVVSGRFDGLPNHHTDTEDGAWWQVDLEQIEVVEKIMIFNRVDDMRGRFRNFFLSGSLDGASWKEFFRKADNVEFGGLDGRPFIFTPEDAVSFRFLRITQIGIGPIDLSHVFVFRRTP